MIDKLNDKTASTAGLLINAVSAAGSCWTKRKGAEKEEEEKEEEESR